MLLDLNTGLPLEYVFRSFLQRKYIPIAVVVVLMGWSIGGLGNYYLSVTDVEAAVLHQLAGNGRMTYDELNWQLSDDEQRYLSDAIRRLRSAEAIERKQTWLHDVDGNRYEAFVYSLPAKSAR